MTFLSALSAASTNDVAQIVHLEQQPTFALVPRDAEQTLFRQKVNVKLEEIENTPQSYEDDRIRYYNRDARNIRQLPFKDRSIEISPRDNNVQRLLKQQLNDALEIYQITGQLLVTKQLAQDFWRPSALPTIQVAIAQANLATNPSEKFAATNLCLKVALEWERDNSALDQAGVGTRSDVLKAGYYRRYCEIQRMKLGGDALRSSVIKEFRPPQESSKELQEIKSITLPQNEGIDKLPPENRDRAQQFRRDVDRFINPLIGYYNANLRLLKLIPRRQSLESRTEDSDLLKLQKQQVSEAIELIRLRGLYLSAALLTDTKGTSAGAITNPTAEIMLPAIGVALAETNFVTNPKDQAVANEVGLKIAQAWEKTPFAGENTALLQRFVVLTARYWRRHCEIQKLLTQPAQRG